MCLRMRNPIRSYPWLTNVTLYSSLYAGGDLMQQYLSSRRNRKIDWIRTRNVAIVAFCFNGNFNFFWMRFLERRVPGTSVSRVLRKLLMDQTISLPLAISGFYTGLSLLEGEEDILENWRNKFLNTYTTGLMFWPFAQCLNFALVPLYLRTTFTGCCAFVWATFLCFSGQHGDGTLNAALTWIHQLKGKGKVPESSESK